MQISATVSGKSLCPDIWAKPRRFLAYFQRRFLYWSFPGSNQPTSPPCFAESGGPRTDLLFRARSGGFRVLEMQRRLTRDPRGPSLGASTGSISLQGRSGVGAEPGQSSQSGECIMMQSLVRILLAQPSYKLLILQYYLFWCEVAFRPALRGFWRLVRESIEVRDCLLEILACFAREYLSAAIPWLTFSGARSVLLSQKNSTVHRSSRTRATCSHRDPSSARCSIQSAGR